MSDTVNLWPDLGNEAPPQKSPYEILWEQASLLAEKTKNRVWAEVTTGMDSFGMPVTDILDEGQSFYLELTMANEYRYTLIAVYYSVLPYPSIIVYKPTGDKIKVNNEDEFIGTLHTLFQKHETITILIDMINQDLDYSLENNAFE